METAAEDDAPIRVGDLTVLRGSEIVVRNVSFVVPMGTVVALVGPRGAGKTTILQALAGLVEPHSGTVTLRDNAYLIDGPVFDPEAIRDLSHAGGAVLVASPSMRDVADLADDVVILRRGSVVVRSSVSDLRASAARTGAVRVTAANVGRLGVALTAVGRACFHVSREVVRVYDITEAELRAIAASAGLALDAVDVEGPDLEVVYRALVS